MAEHIRAKYDGSGEYYGGIPAADLTDAEFDALTAEQRAIVESSPHYRMRDPASARSSAPSRTSAAAAEAAAAAASLANDDDAPRNDEPGSGHRADDDDAPRNDEPGSGHRADDV